MKTLNKDTLICSIKYTLLVSILVGCRFIIWDNLCLNYFYPNLFGITLQILWFAIIELIIIQITSAFAYMLIHHKKKFKRFFSFMHIKYFKFNILMLVTYALFWGCCTFIVNNLRFLHSFNRHSRFKLYILAIILLVLNAFKMIFSYFRAENQKESLSKITKSFFTFLYKNLKEVFLFLIKFFPWIVGYIFLIVLFDKTDFEIVVYVILNSSLYGLGILFFPYYFINLHKLVSNLQLSS